MLMSEWTVSTSFKHVTMWEKHHPGHISMDENPLCFWRRYMLTCKIGGKKETKVAESVKYLKASSDRLSFASFLCCVHTTLLSESSARWALHTPRPHDPTMWPTAPLDLQSYCIKNSLKKWPRKCTNTSRRPMSLNMDTEQKRALQVDRAESHPDQTGFLAC